MANLKPHINGKNGVGTPINGIATINIVQSGPTKGAGFIKFEKDQSGFAGLYDPETGEVDVKATESRMKGSGRIQLEGQPNITASGNNRISKDEVEAILNAGHFAANEKGNYVGSLGATLRHSHDKFGWIPDVSQPMTEGYPKTAAIDSYEGLMEARATSRNNAACARAVEKGETQIRLQGASVETPSAPAPEAKAAEAPAPAPAPATVAKTAEAPQADDGIDFD